MKIHPRVMPGILRWTHHFRQGDSGLIREPRSRVVRTRSISRRATKSAVLTMIVFAGVVVAAALIGPAHLPHYSVLSTRIGSAILMLLLVTVAVCIVVMRFRRR